MIRCGIVIFPTDKTLQPIPLAQAVEERGLDALYLPEHTHIPVDSKSPFLPGGEVPDHYRRTHDPFVALSAAAAVTERITLATGICLVPQRDPITLAKEVASLDLISNGRVLLGIGAGWNEPELANHGVQFDQRWAVTREYVDAMRTIWREDEAEYQGEFVNFGKMWSYPKPVQADGPPIWIGANSKYIPARLAEYANGWMPIYGRAGGATVAMVKEAFDRKGRDFNELSLAMFMAPDDEAELASLRGEGFKEFIFGVASAAPDDVLKRLDQIAQTAEKLNA